MNEAEAARQKHIVSLLYQVPRLLTQAKTDSMLPSLASVAVSDVPLRHEVLPVPQA
jgi:hypothetical protein